MLHRFKPTTLCLALALAGCASAPHKAAPEVKDAAASTALPEQPALTAQTLKSGGVMPVEQTRMHFNHAELHFIVDPAHQSLDARAVLTFTAKSTLDTLLLDLDHNLAIIDIKLDGHPVEKTEWSNPDGRLSIHLPAPLTTGHSVTADIRYVGRPHVAKNAPWDGGFVWSHTADGQPWVASAVEGEGCDLFWPCIDQTEGEPDLVDTYVTVAKNLAAPGNGTLIGITDEGDEHTYHWRIQHPNTYAISINVGPFKELQANYTSRYGNIIPMQYWYLPGSEGKAQALFSEFPHMLDFFEQQIGPYPFSDEKMGVVQTPHLGMEHQTLNAYGNNYAKNGYGFDWLLQHEFSHEWFGNQVTNTDWDDMWLHEGFATYMQPLYGRYLYGDMPYYAMLRTEREALKNRYPIVSGHSQTEDQVYDAVHGPGNDIYYKGSLMLHSLRHLIGDRDFFASIRLLVYGRLDPKPGNFTTRYASTHDYMAIVDKVTGRKLDWFFKVYLYDAELPKLEVDRHGNRVDLRWTTEHGEDFPMPVDVQVGERVQTVKMSAKGEGHLTVPARSLMIIDPHSTLLRDMPHIDAYQAWKKQQKAAHPDK